MLGYFFGCEWSKFTYLHGTCCLCHMFYRPASHHPLSQHNTWCWTEEVFLGSSLAAVFVDQPSVVSHSLHESSERSLHHQWNSICVLVLQGLSVSRLCVPTSWTTCERSALRGSTGWSLAVVPQVKMQLHILPEVENLFPAVSRAVGYASKNCEGAIAFCSWCCC